jgi:hypothetical protein
MTRALLLFASAAVVTSADAQAVTFGTHDVATVFFVSKSDDRNRVDYGVRLDEVCAPVGDAPMFLYWRRFEPGQARFGRLNELDRQAYGIAGQRVLRITEGESRIEVRLRQLSDRILVLVRPDGRGGCRAEARATLDGRDAVLDHVHVQLAGLRVDSITIVGRAEGRRVEVRRTP